MGSHDQVALHFRTGGSVQQVLDEIAHDGKYDRRGTSRPQGEFAPEPPEESTPRQRALSKIHELRQKHGDRVFMKEAAAEYIRIVTSWALTDEQASELVALEPGELEGLRADDWGGSLDDDQLLRISAVLGTDSALRAKFDERQIRQWIASQHWSPLFGGSSPIHMMLEGGFESIVKARRFAEAIRFGA